VVTGRAWVSQHLPSPSTAHSTSWGLPKCSCTRAPSRTSAATWSSVRQAASGAGRWTPFPSLRSRTAPVCVRTTKWSGSTAPLTTASPSPGLASMTLCPRAPVTGSAVKSTPATAASTIRCTTTASSVRAWSTRLRVRYSTARSVQSDAQHRWTASRTASAPSISR
jgi:hypothetical protein